MDSPEEGSSLNPSDWRSHFYGIRGGGIMQHVRQAPLVDASLEPARCTDAATPDALLDVASRGSWNHHKGQCNPCKYVVDGKPCPRGQKCDCCHFRHGPEKFLAMNMFKALSQQKRSQRRQAKGLGADQAAAAPRVPAGGGPELQLSAELLPGTAAYGCSARSGLAAPAAARGPPQALEARAAPAGPAAPAVVAGCFSPEPRLVAPTNGPWLLPSEAAVGSSRPAHWSSLSPCYVTDTQVERLIEGAKLGLATR